MRLKQVLTYDQVEPRDGAQTKVRSNYQLLFSFIIEFFFSARDQTQSLMHACVLEFEFRASHLLGRCSTT
jgi:hypothetical protein